MKCLAIIGAKAGVNVRARRLPNPVSLISNHMSRDMLMAFQDLPKSWT